MRKIVETEFPLQEFVQFDAKADELKLPINSTIAKISRDFFLQRAPLLTSYEEERLAEEGILKAIYGIDTVTSFGVSASALYALRRAFSSPKYPLVVVGDSGESTGVMINTLAAARVIELNPDFFPQEARINSGIWVYKNLGFLSQAQNGLLSGIPLESVLKYPLWEQVMVRDFSGKRQPYSYSESIVDMRSGKITQETFAQMAKIYLGNRYTQDQISYLIKAALNSINNRRNVIEGIIFTDEDDKYCQKATDFFLHLASYEDTEIPELASPFL